MLENTPTDPQCHADHFDGRQARPARVTLVRDGATLRLLDASGEQRLDVPMAQVQWPPRTRHGVRVARLPGGGMLQAVDTAAFDAWMRAHARPPSLIDRSQQSWRAVLLATLVLCVVLATTYHWGMPWAARMVLLAVPDQIDRGIGETALSQLDGRLFQPTRVTPERQAHLQRSLSDALDQAYPSPRPPYEVHFRRSRIGPNALALPGGVIVVTDELVALLDGDDTVLLGVMAHEYSHVRHRHGMRMLVQVGLLGAVTSLAVGDFSGLLAAAPALLGHMGYSRALEREADDDAIHVLLASGHDPAVMVRLFERLRATQPGADADEGLFGIAFSSHPSDAQRIARFRAASP